MNDVPGVKTCTRCGVEKPNTGDFFVVHKSYPGGLRPDCKECRRKRYNPKRVPPRETGKKVCSVCGEEKNVTEFYAKNTTSDGRTAHCKECSKELKRKKNENRTPPEGALRKCCKCNSIFPLTTDYFYSNKQSKYGFDYECKECSKNRRREWTRNNPDKNAAKSRRYRKANPEKVLERNRSYAARHREKIREYHNQWAKDNPDKRRLYRTAIRAKRAEAEGTHTIAELKTQYDSQEGRCYYCQKEVSFEEAHADHYIPLARGGSNYIENIVIACPLCNQRKSAMMPDDFIRRGIIDESA